MILAKKRTHWVGAVMASLLALGLGACSDSKTPAATDAGGVGGSGAGTGGSGAGVGGSGTGAGGSGAGGATAKGGAGGTATGVGGSGTGAGGTGAGGTGAGGTGAGGATAGDGGTVVCNIPCLENVFKECPTNGTTCVEQSAPPPALTSNTCYSNGVKSRFTFALTGLKIENFKAGGAACFSIEANLMGMLTVKDGAGAVVATGNFDSTTMKQTVTCGGQTYDLSMCMDPPGDPASMCTDGTCAIP